MSQSGRGTAAVRGENLSSPIVCWVTEIVNQPFPSKVHALTGRVNPLLEYLRGTAEVLLPGDDRIGQFTTPASGKALEESCFRPQAAPPTLSSAEPLISIRSWTTGTLASAEENRVAQPPSAVQVFLVQRISPILSMMMAMKQLLMAAKPQAPEARPQVSPH